MATSTVQVAPGASVVHVVVRENELASGPVSATEIVPVVASAKLCTSKLNVGLGAPTSIVPKS